jgi:excisionase family DNA binding protein
MEELFTVREVSDQLKIAVSTVYRYVESGVFPHSKIGPNIRFTNNDIARFLIAQKRQTTTPVTNSTRAIYDNIDWMAS